MNNLMTILYADDDRDDRDLMTEALNEIDPSISVHMFNDGQELLSILRKNSELPDYIFLDINMPVMNGKECLIALKKDKRLREIPVVIYSTTIDNSEVSEFYLLGAYTFIRKPNNFADLCIKLNLFIKLAQN
jgi:CheY-like chemotaxis protein